MSVPVWRRTRKKEQEEKQEEKREEETISDVNKFNEWVNIQEIDINTELFTKHFKFQRPSDMFKYPYQTNHRNKNHELVNILIVD